MGFSFNRISDFFVLVLVVVVVQEVLHERGFSKLGASRAKNFTLNQGCLSGLDPSTHFFGQIKVKSR